MPVVSISLPKKLLESIDQFIITHGYAGRSELIRDSIRFFLEVKGPEAILKGRSGWVIIVLTDHESSPYVDQRVIGIIHSYQPVVRLFHHQILKGGLCLSMAVIEAYWSEVQSILKVLRKTRGVIKVWSVAVPYGEREG